MGIRTSISSWFFRNSAGLPPSCDSLRRKAASGRPWIFSLWPISSGDLQPDAFHRHGRKSLRRPQRAGGLEGQQRPHAVTEEDQRQVLHAAQCLDEGSHDGGDAVERGSRMRVPRPGKCTACRPMPAGSHWVHVWKTCGAPPA